MLGRHSIMALMLAVACALALPLPASAQTPAQTNWAGPYGGGHVGFNRAGLNVSENGYPEGSIDLEGLTYGLFAGVNLPISPRTLIGLEGDYSWTNMDGWIACHVFGLEASASLRARLGYLPSDNTLVFITGGAARTRFEYVGMAPPPVVTVTPPQTFIDDWVWGYILGLGIEQKLFDFMRLRLEYLYSDYPSWEFVTTSDAYDLENDLHTLRVGVVIPIGAP